MLFRIGAPNIGWAAVFIYLPFLVLAIHILTRRDCYGDLAAIERHLTDFPYERDLQVWNGYGAAPSESVKKDQSSFESVRFRSR
jgi:hypothetical protein